MFSLLSPIVLNGKMNLFNVYVVKIESIYRNTILNNIDVIHDGFNSEFRIILAVVEMNSFKCCYNTNIGLYKKGKCLYSYELFLGTSRPVAGLNI